MDPDFIGFVVVISTFATLGIAGYTAIRFVNVRIRRMEHREPSAEMLAELDDLRARVHDLETDRARVTELEERVDFAERLLVRGSDQLAVESRGEQ